MSDVSLRRSFCRGFSSFVLLFVLVVAGIAAPAIVPMAPVAYQYLGWRDDVTLAPLEPLAALLGMRVTHDGGRVIVQLGEKRVVYQPDNTSVMQQELPEVAFTEGAVTYVPIRQFLNQFGGTIIDHTPGDISRLRVALGKQTVTLLVDIRDGFPGKACGASELFCMEIDGANLRRLTYTAGEERLPAILPDGSLVCYEDRRLVLRKADNPIPSWSVDAWWNSPNPPIVSPDGKTIFFERYLDAEKDEEPQVTIWSVDADGKGLRLVTTGMNPCLHPGGKVLAFEQISESVVEDNAICLINVDGTEMRSVGKGNRPRYSPDGRWLQYSLEEYEDAEDMRIMKMHIFDGDQVKEDGTSLSCAGTAWSADSARYAYASLTDPQGLRIRNPRTEEEEVITRNPDDYHPLFLPDGKQFLFLRRNRALGCNDLYLFDLTSKQETRLTLGMTIEDFRLTPDGACILFTTVPGGARTIARDPITGITAEEAVRMNFDKFTALYEGITGGHSHPEMWEMYRAYLALRYQQNMLQAAALPLAQQAQYVRVAHLLDSFTTAYVDIDMDESGGGTVYGLLSIKVDVRKEGTLTKVLMSLAQPEKKNPTARKQAKAQLTDMEQFLAAKPKALTDEGNAAYNDDYQQSLASAKQQLRALNELLAELPDFAAGLITAYLSQIEDDL